MTSLLAFPDTGTCTVIREGVVTHKCERPGPRETDRLGEGAVVVCTCGRRYIARRHYTWSSLTWDRRIWPWPRAPKNGQDGAPA